MTPCTVSVTEFEPREGTVASAVIPTPTYTRMSVNGTFAFSERICETSMTATNAVKASSIVATATARWRGESKLSSRSDAAKTAVDGRLFPCRGFVYG